jgi:ribosomal protein S2
LKQYSDFHTETLNDARKKVDLEVNTVKTEFMFLSCHKNAGQNHDTKIGNRCFENVVQFRYLGTTITHKNLIQGEIKAYHHSYQNLLSFRLLFRNIKIRLYKTIILPVVLYGCETWS